MNTPNIVDYSSQIAAYSAQYTALLQQWVQATIAANTSSQSNPNGDDDTNNSTAVDSIVTQMNEVSANVSNISAVIESNLEALQQQTYHPSQIIAQEQHTLQSIDIPSTQNKLADTRKLLADYSKIAKAQKQKNMCIIVGIVIAFVVLLCLAFVHVGVAPDIQGKEQVQVQEIQNQQQ